MALRTECGQPLPLASLFLHVIVKDYVPDGLSELAEALANPIKYQSEVEKREKQLSVLTDCLDVPTEELDVRFEALRNRCPLTHRHTNNRVLTFSRKSRKSVVKEQVLLSHHL